MNINITLKYLFNKLYNNGEFIKLIVEIKDIKKINNYYKKNFSKFKDFNNFIENMDSLKNKLLKSKSAYSEIKKQFLLQKGLQPAVLTECFIIQTIANLFELTEFIDVDEKEEKMPKDLSLKLLSFEGIAGKTFPRYIFHNRKNKIILLQYGSSTSIDAIFIKSKIGVRLEFKEEKSKLEEIDIPAYNENGQLIINKQFQKKYENYVDYINIFNKETTIFKSIGQNFKINDYLESNNINQITEKFLNAKIVELFILQQKNKIYPIFSKDLLKNIDLSGSEIRSAGRNSYSVFTPKYVQKIIKELNGTINKEKVILPFNEKNKTKGRNISKDTRYKINNLLFVKLENTKIDSKFIRFNLKDIKQLKPTISLHLNVKINEENLKQRYQEFKN